MSITNINKSKKYNYLITGDSGLFDQKIVFKI